MWFAEREIERLRDGAVARCFAQAYNSEEYFRTLTFRLLPAEYVLRIFLE